MDWNNTSNVVLRSGRIIFENHAGEAAFKVYPILFY